MKSPSNLSARVRWLAAILPLAAWPAFAQTAATPMDAANNPKEEDVLVLSPFVVSTSSEAGYYTPEAMGATRTRTALIDLPLNLTVFNENFINDIGARDLADIIAFASGVSQAPTPSSDVGGGDTLGANIRGQSAFVPNRNGVRRLRVVDPVTIQRVEVIKGPNSLLYGPAAPGGGINYLTKRPVQRKIATATIQAGSYDFYKGSFDVNVPAFDKSLAVRFVGSYEDSRSWIDRLHKTQEVLYPSLTWWIRPETTFTVEYEQTKQDRSPPQALLPQHNWLDPDDVARLVGRGWNMRGQHDYQRTEMTAFTAELQHKFSDNLNLRMNWSDVVWEDDVKNSAPGIGISNLFGTAAVGSSTSPSAGGTSAPGNPMLLGGRAHGYTKRGSWDSYRQVELYNTFEVKGVKVQNLFGYQRGKEQFRQILATSGAAADSVRWNISDPSTWILSERFAETDPIFYSSGTGAVFQNKLSSGYLINQLALFDDRLRTLAGVRVDSIRGSAYSNPTIANTVRYGTGAPPPPNPNVAWSYSKYPSKTSPQFGLLYKAAKGVSVFANYSTSLVNLYTTLARRPDGTEFTPVPGTGEGFDVGIKTDMFKGKVTGVVSIYRLEEQDIVRQLATVSLPHINNGAPFVPSEQSGINRSEGVDLDVVVRPQKGLQIGFGYAYNDSWVVSDTSAFTYLNGGASNGTKVETRTGHQLAYAAKHRFSAYFRKDLGAFGPFTNTYVTGSGSFVDDRPYIEAWYKKVASATDGGALVAPPLLDGYKVFNLGFGGEFKIQDARFNASVMVKNILDEDYLANRFVWGAPREFMFTLRMTF